MYDRDDDEAKFYRNKGFALLNRQWKKKLKESGFNDLEKSVHEYARLPLTIDINSATFKSREASEVYFDIASDHLRNGSFKSQVEREVWEHHSQGDTLSEIGHKMKLGKSTIAYYVWKVQRLLRLKRSSK